MASKRVKVVGKSEDTAFLSVATPFLENEQVKENYGEVLAKMRHVSKEFRSSINLGHAKERVFQHRTDIFRELCKRMALVLAKPSVKTYTVKAQCKNELSQGSGDMVLTVKKVFEKTSPVTVREPVGGYQLHVFTDIPELIEMEGDDYVMGCDILKIPSLRYAEDFMNWMQSAHFNSPNNNTTINTIYTIRRIAYQNHIRSLILHRRALIQYNIEDPDMQDDVRKWRNEIVQLRQDLVSQRHLQDTEYEKQLIRFYMNVYAEMNRFAERIANFSKSSSSSTSGGDPKRFKPLFQTIHLYYKLKLLSFLGQNPSKPDADAIRELFYVIVESDYKDALFVAVRAHVDEKMRSNPNQHMRYYAYQTYRSILTSNREYIYITLAEYLVKKIESLFSDLSKTTFSQDDQVYLESSMRQVKHDFLCSFLGRHALLYATLFYTNLKNARPPAVRLDTVPFVPAPRSAPRETYEIFDITTIEDYPGQSDVDNPLDYDDYPLMRGHRVPPTEDEQQSPCVGINIYLSYMELDSQLQQNIRFYIKKSENLQTAIQNILEQNEMLYALIWGGDHIQKDIVSNDPEFVIPIANLRARKIMLTYDMWMGLTTVETYINYMKDNTHSIKDLFNFLGDQNRRMVSGIPYNGPAVPYGVLMKQIHTLDALEGISHVGGKQRKVMKKETKKR